MANGEVIDETGRRINPQSAYRAGACIFYYRELENEQVIPFAERVLYQDEHLLVADKPHFLPVIPSGRFLHQTLLVRLRKRYDLESLAPIHRPRSRDCGSGVVFREPENKRPLHFPLRNQVTKVYEAVAPTLKFARVPTTRRSRIVQGQPFFA
jgi:tRNA pseudouridine32 synthase/23S rRNA pseudouridine746 synthase